MSTPYIPPPVIVRWGPPLLHPSLRLRSMGNTEDGRRWSKKTLPAATAPPWSWAYVISPLTLTRNRQQKTEDRVESRVEGATGQIKHKAVVSDKNLWIVIIWHKTRTSRKRWKGSFCLAFFTRPNTPSSRWGSLCQCGEWHGKRRKK